MLSTLTLSLALCVCPVQDDEPPLPSRETVEAALEDLEEAFESDESEVRAAAVERNSLVDHPDVIEFLLDSFDDESEEVVAQCIGALRWLEHPDALEGLHAKLRRDKRLRRNHELYASLIQAIGQHASEDSIELLKDDLFKIEERAVVRARVLSLAHIRTPDALEAVMGAMKKAGERKVRPYMPEFRLALMVLTGVDRGLAQQEWVDWWNDNKREFELPEEAPSLPRTQSQQWNRFWGYDYDMGRGTRRENRGNDPEGGPPPDDAR